MSGPWEDYATGPWTDYGGEQPAAMPMDQFNAELTRLVQAQDRAGALALAEQQGQRVDNLDQALEAARAGRGFTIHNNTAEITPETVGQALYRGVGDVAEGAGDLLGIVANPVNAGINYLAGTNLSTDLGRTFRDAIGAPAPITKGEQYLSAISEGGASALAGAGLGRLASAAPGMTGYVAEQVAANPVKDVAGGVTGATGSETGGDIGGKVAGRPGEIVGSIAGGLVGGIGGVRASEAAAARLAARVPAESVFDSAGRLTAEGHELAMRVGADPEDVQRAYARVREGRPRPANGQARREAVRNRQPVPPADVPIQPTAEMPQRIPLPDQNARMVDAIGDRIRSGDAFDAPAAPPLPPREVNTEAREEGIRLTRGQAEQNFEVQNDENSLRVSTSKEGTEARSFFDEQQQQIKDALGRFKDRFGADPGTAADRGEVLQQAVRDLRDAGAEGVRALYRQAEESGGEALKLSTNGIREAATDVLIDEAVPEGVKRAVSQELARYGIIGKAEPTNEAGLTRVRLDDGSAVTFRGPVKELSAANAEDLRRAINRLYDPTKPNLSGQSIKPAIDDALEEALAQGSQREGQIGDLYRQARSGYQEQRRTFHASDIIDSLAASKKGTNTPALLPERAVAQTIGAGKNGVTNLRRVKGLLLSSGRDDARQAWAAIQHQGIADLLDAATVRNGSGGVEAISGAKLRTAIFRTFGADKLKTLLGQEEFDRLMKLQRVIGAATIPISGTTNPSGTATKLINYMKAGTLRLAAPIPGLSTIVDSGGNLLRKAKEISATRKTLEGITSYEGEQSGRDMDARARRFIRDYIDSGTSGRFVPTSVTLSATQGPKE